MNRLPKIIASKFCNSRGAYSLFRAPQLISSFSCCLQASSPGFLPMISNRSISTAYDRTFDMVKQSKATVDSTEWQTVYRFPFIVHARVFSRSKLYLTLITLISAPNAIVLYTLDALPFKEMVGILIEFLDIADIAPLADYNEDMNSIFLRVNPTFLSKDTLQESLYISLRFGGIINRQKFAHIFGPV
ncbi:hypothetical protein TYRP_001318 [Tyrophagus putrescentiae]|nr:hypothetical protein TYRP_001318 [Tyrophagus putrescentiae]